MISDSPQSKLYQTRDVASFVLPVSKEGEKDDRFYASFTIQDTRELTERAYLRPTEGKTKQIIIRANFVTHEAQNALLKVVEEPPSGTNLTFILPPDLILLPTLRSRLSIMGVDDNEEINDNDPFNHFLNKSYSERLIEIESALKKKDEEWQREIKQGLIKYLPKSHLYCSGEVVKALEMVSRLLLTRGASNKLLLEQLALSLPIRSLVKKW
jgi:hypothetical protein